MAMTDDSYDLYLILSFNCLCILFFVYDTSLLLGFAYLLEALCFANSVSCVWRLELITSLCLSAFFSYRLRSCGKNARGDKSPLIPPKPKPAERQGAEGVSEVWQKYGYDILGAGKGHAPRPLPSSLLYANVSVQYVLLCCYRAHTFSPGKCVGAFFIDLHGDFMYVYLYETAFDYCD